MPVELNTLTRFAGRYNPETHTMSGYPIEGAYVSTFFNVVDELHPRGHSGVDLACPFRTPVYNPAPGVVNIVFDRDPINVGNYVTIDHQDNLTSSYWHLDEIAPNVVPGAYLVEGEFIGYAGATGEAYTYINGELKRGVPEATHLHWMCGPTNSNQWMSNQRELWNALDLMERPVITVEDIQSYLTNGGMWTHLGPSDEINGAEIIKIVFPITQAPGPRTNTNPQGAN